MLKIKGNPYWRYAFAARPARLLIFRRLAIGFELHLPFVSIRLGHETPKCRECGERHEVLCWDEHNPGAAICPDCCQHDSFTYERSERTYFCDECGIDRHDTDYDYSED